MLGLVSPAKDYRVAWCINRRLGLSLAKADDLFLDDPRTARNLSFGRFTHTDQLDRVEYLLLGNRGKSESIHPKLKSFDYLLLVKGEIDEARMKSVQQALESEENLQLILPADASLLKGVGPVIFDYT